MGCLVWRVLGCGVQRLNAWYFGLAAVVTGCVTSVQQQGQSLKAINVHEIKPGIDTMTSIEARYGRPSTVSLFPGSSHTERWYYTHRILQETPVKGRRSVTHRSLVIIFDKSGRVVRCEGITGEQNVSIKTKTTQEKGYETNFLKETFRNIGKFGQGGSLTHE